MQVAILHLLIDISPLLSNLIYLLAVSYTHLDVYKRQELYPFSHSHEVKTPVKEWHWQHSTLCTLLMVDDEVVIASDTVGT